MNKDMLTAFLSSIQTSLNPPPFGVLRVFNDDRVYWRVEDKARGAARYTIAR